ncbi:MAG: SDR family NAD(P)-dependent oxidoreductase [Chloroflexota bacterium]
MKLEGKVALVTGAGSGIGRATALRFAQEGVAIAVNDINLPTAEETAQMVRQAGARAIAIEADVGEADQAEAMVEQAVRELGGVDILVNNAGIAPEMAPTVEQSLEKWDRLIKVHLRGTYLCSRYAGKHMIARKWGRIVNLGSVVGVSGFPMRTDYGPAKAGIINMTKVLAMEWARYNINVNCIAPGYIMTRLIRGLIDAGRLSAGPIEAKVPLGRFGQPEDVARAALFLVSEDASYITGAVLPVDGGWQASGFAP